MYSCKKAVCRSTAGIASHYLQVEDDFFTFEGFRFTNLQDEGCFHGKSATFLQVRMVSACKTLLIL